ncbi:hypothetical protein [Pseudolysinimonas yzui]|nr:hypothetical protein [Pseudolysinimonas yzui]
MTWAAGSTFGRLFFRGGAHATEWDTFRSFGPVSTMRFDHHPPPAKEHPKRAITYLAPSTIRAGSQDPFEVCVVETYSTTKLIDTRSREPWFTLWSTTRDLIGLDVVDGPWLARAHGNAAISSGPRAISRDWSRAIYRSFDTLDGIYYGTSSLPMARSVALFERARSALPARYLLALPLSHPGFGPALRRIAATYGYDLIV